MTRTLLGLNGAHWPTSKAVINYDPKRRPGFPEAKTRWWCAAHTDEGLSRYLRFVLNRNRMNITMEPGHGILKPPHPAHISIVRGWNDVKQVPWDELNALWGKYEGKEITFQYSLEEHRSPAGHWFVEVRHPMFFQIREELDLPRDWKFHLTFGREFGR
jgi:hypothetical protein